MGGIEKFNRAFMKALVHLQDSLKFSVAASGLYDSEADGQYIPVAQYNFYKGRKISFLFSSFWKSLRSEEIILGHLNLSVIAVIVKFLRPSRKVTLICHGIEVFEPVGGLKKKALEKADRILAVSRFTKSQLVNVQRIPESKVIVFPNTVDPYFQLPVMFDKPKHLLNRYGITSNDKLLFTLTRLNSNEQYKGYDNVIRILPQLLATGIQVKYIIAGRADEKEGERIRGLIKELELENHVILAGFIPDEEVVDHYLLADMYVMPSKGEGFGIVFIEAMACGLPVVAGNKDGSTEALQFGKLGTLVDPDNKVEIRDAVLSLLQQEKQSQAIQKNVMQYFSFDQFKKRLELVLS